MRVESPLAWRATIRQGAGTRSARAARAPGSGCMAAPPRRCEPPRPARHADRAMRPPVPAKPPGGGCRRTARSSAHGDSGAVWWRHCSKRTTVHLGRCGDLRPGSKTAAPDDPLHRFALHLLDTVRPRLLRGRASTDPGVTPCLSVKPAPSSGSTMPRASAYHPAERCRPVRALPFHPGQWLQVAAGRTAGVVQGRRPEGPAGREVERRSLAPSLDRSRGRHRTPGGDARGPCFFAGRFRAGAPRRYPSRHACVRYAPAAIRRTSLACSCSSSPRLPCCAAWTRMSCPA